MGASVPTPPLLFAPSVNVEPRRPPSLFVRESQRQKIEEKLLTSDLLLTHALLVGLPLGPFLQPGEFGLCLAQSLTALVPLRLLAFVEWSVEVDFPGAGIDLKVVGVRYGIGARLAVLSVQRRLVSSLAHFAQPNRPSDHEGFPLGQGC